MAKTNKHIILQLRRKIMLMAQEIEGLRIELSQAEEKIMMLEFLLEPHTDSLFDARKGGGKHD